MNAFPSLSYTHFNYSVITRFSGWFFPTNISRCYSSYGSSWGARFSSTISLGRATRDRNLKRKGQFGRGPLADLRIETLTIIGTEDLALCNMSLVHNSTWYPTIVIGLKNLTLHANLTSIISVYHSWWFVSLTAWHLSGDILQSCWFILTRISLAYFDSNWSRSSQTEVKVSCCLRQRNFTREFNKELTFDSISHDSGWKTILMERL